MPLAGRAHAQLVAGEQTPRPAMRPLRLHHSIPAAGRMHISGCNQAGPGIVKTASKDRDVLHESDIMNLYPASPLNRAPSPRATKAGKAGSKLAARTADSGHQNDWTLQCMAETSVWPKRAAWVGRKSRTTPACQGGDSN